MKVYISSSWKQREDVLNWLAADELAQATAKLRAAFDSVHGI